MDVPSRNPRFFGRKRLRLQYQTAAAECGLACLAMVLTFHGKRTDLSALRQAWPVSVKGMTLAQLIEIAHTMGMSARPLRLELKAIGRLRTPCILHWGLDHFVVLARANPRCAILLDPAAGEKKVPIAEVSKMFSGVALELAPTGSFSKAEARGRLQFGQFFRNSGGITRALVQLLGLSIALQAFTLLIPFYSQLVIDDIVLSGDVDLLLVAAFGFGGLAVFIAITSGFRSWLIIYMSSVLNLSWSSGLFQHLLSLPYDYFEKRQIGDIQSRFGSLKAIQDLFTTQVVESIIDGMMAASTLVVMYLYSPVLAGIAILSVLLYLATRWALFGPLRAASLETLVRNAARDTFFLETVRGVLAIKNFGNESFRRVGFENRVSDGIAAAADAARIRVWSEILNKLNFGVLNVVLIWVAARSIIAGQFTVGMMVAFLAYKIQFVARSSALVDKVFQFRLARIHLDRLEDIVEAAPEDASGPDAVRAVAPKRSLVGAIEVRNVWFRYGRNEPFVLRDQSFAISPGEHVAVTGPSGAGKSTLLKLLIGLANPEKGEILVDGTPSRSMDLPSYRRQIGVVMQNDYLLSGSLLDNVTFFSANPDRERAKACCRIAGIANEIDAMPMGYLTLVGDMGDVFSGGQRQRILLARALYKDPKILFLDEATSHLDAAHESHLVAEISALKITRVVIAHRRETIRHADRVIELRRPLIAC